MSLILRTLATLGFLLFAALFALTFASPDALERAAQGFIRYQIEKEVAEKLQDERLAPFKAAASALADKYRLDIDQIQIDLKNELPKKIAAVVAALCRLDCAARRGVEGSVTAGYQKQIALLAFARDRLGQLIADKYAEVVENLTRDIRIFFGSNALLFGLVLLLSCWRRDATVHLLLPAGLLLLATLIGSAIYVFGQDWFFVVVYNDYLGFAYLIYVAAAFALLLDLIVNKGRVTTEIINAILNLVGSAFSLTPCG